MNNGFLTGAVEGAGNLFHYRQSELRSVIRRGMSVGVQKIVKGVQSRAPVGKSGSVRDAVGGRLMRTGDAGSISAMVGIGVGKRALPAVSSSSSSSDDEYDGPLPAVTRSSLAEGLKRSSQMSRTGKASPAKSSGGGAVRGGSGGNRARSGRSVRQFEPHAHLVALGTVARFTASGAARGVMPSNDFVLEGFMAENTRAVWVVAAEADAYLRRLGGE